MRLLKLCLASVFFWLLHPIQIKTRIDWKNSGIYIVYFAFQYQIEKKEDSEDEDDEDDDNFMSKKKDDATDDPLARKF